MPQAITPFLMFQGAAEDAINLYLSLFDGAELVVLERHGPEGPAAEGSVKRATLRLAGQELRCFDSPIGHAFTFTPSFSLFVDCVDEADQERLFGALSEGGEVLMALADYGFSKKFGWVNDRFGVSWQINLP